MKVVWISVAVVCALACSALGYLIINKKPGYPMPKRTVGAGEDVPEDMIAELQKVDPKLVICREAARLKTSLKELRGVAVGPDDRIHAVGDKALIVLGPDGAEIARVPLDHPAFCVGVGPDSTIYVGMKEHVEVFDAKGAKKAAWPTLGPKGWITSIAASENEVFVADFNEKKIHRYDKDGKVLGHIGSQGKEGARFEVPSPNFDVGLDSTGAPWVAHTGRRLLEGYRKDGSLATSWGKSAPTIDGFSGCCNPSHIAVRKDGSFITAEKGLVRVKIHSPAGDFVGVVAAAKDFEKGIHGLDLAVDSKDRILVADPATSSVRVYVLK